MLNKELNKLRMWSIILTPWNELPNAMKNEEVRKYYSILERKNFSLILKRIFDIFLSSILIVFFSPLLFLIFIIIKFDSPGKAIFRQKRVTKDGKIFNILKFRTMVENAESIGSGVTVKGDPRITRCGRWIRKLRLDEFPQLFNIFKGELSFVGTRPELPRYVEQYTPEMYATLLLSAGVTSFASIFYKDESKLLEGSEDPDETYLKDILPEKMNYNLEYIKKIGFWYDIKIIIKTVLAVIKR